MGRWEILKEFITESDIVDGENYIEVGDVLAKMSSLESLPIAEIEIPENTNGFCSIDCPLFRGNNIYINKCFKGYAENVPASLNSKYILIKPGSSCPQYKGEKG